MAVVVVVVDGASAMLATAVKLAVAVVENRRADVSFRDDGDLFVSDVATEADACWMHFDDADPAIIVNVSHRHISNVFFSLSLSS